MGQTSAYLRVGGASALIGGVAGLVGNALHPRPPAETEALLRLVAQMPHWTAIHYMIVNALVFMVAAFVLLVRTLEGSLARALGELARCAALLGGASLMTGIMIDGYGYPRFARLWLAAEGEEQRAIFWAADALHTADMALFTAWATVFLGVTFILAGAALVASHNYSSLLGGVAAIGGVMCLLYAVSVAFQFEVALAVWPAGPAIVSLWMLALGVAMVRKGAARADARTEARG